MPPFFLRFLAAHSLLIGLLPFFLPVWLWQRGMDISGLCVLIGVSGLAFCVSLSAWQHVSTHHSLNYLVVLTFALEILLLITVLLTSSSALPAAGLMLPLLIGIGNGIYNAFFWTTQRTLFVQSMGNNDTGRRYGNFQIVVGAFLKIGILAGGWLLDLGGLMWLLLISVLVASAAAFWLARQPPQPLQQESGTRWSCSLKFQDKQGSHTVFRIDGFFLYLESHFWTVSLFLLVREDFSRLGIVVVVLAIVFALLFWLLKNSIDQWAGNRIFTLAVSLYAFSWVLRAFLENSMTPFWLFVNLVIITFCSSFFRLTFNKRFFENARDYGAVRYLLNKSYVSQWWLGIGFLATGLILSQIKLDSNSALAYSYWLAAVGSFAYLFYRKTYLPANSPSP
ncbi:MAG: hypothetical protein V3U76_20120 [Granulosicoccus sp.]